MTAPHNEEYLKTMLPGLSEEQYSLRGKLRVARDYANSKIATGDLDYHSWQLFYLINDMVGAMVFKPMSDDQLRRVVDYCRALVKCANEAGEIFNDK